MQNVFGTCGATVGKTGSRKMKTRKKHNDKDKADEEDKTKFRCIGQKHLKTVS